MDFLYFGDAEFNHNFGFKCAEAIKNSESFDACYNGIRPIGLALYYSIPHFFTNDSLTSHYISLILNLLMLAMLIYSSFYILKDINSRLAKIIFLIGAIIVSVGFIPVKLTDVQSWGLYVSSVALLGIAFEKNKKKYYFYSGVLAGLAFLLKQNFSMNMFFLFVVWVFLQRKKIQEIKTNILLYLSGCAIILIQFFIVFFQSGYFWMYNPEDLAKYADSNKQPAVELVAYTAPQKSAYLTKLDNTVSGLNYFSIKFYEGLSKFYLSAYLGEAPLDIAPEIIETKKVNFMGTLIFFIAISIYCLSPIFFYKTNPAIFLLSSSTLFATCLNNYMAHVENRYMYPLRYTIILITVFFISKLYKKIKTRFY